MDEEIIEGRLCEKGLMKERYDEKVQDLVRTITPKGTEVVKDLLKNNPMAQKMFLHIMVDTLNRIPSRLHRNFIDKLRNQLK